MAAAYFERKSVAKKIVKLGEMTDVVTFIICLSVTRNLNTDCAVVWFQSTIHIHVYHFLTSVGPSIEKPWKHESRTA